MSKSKKKPPASAPPPLSPEELAWADFQKRFPAAVPAPVEQQEHEPPWEPRDARWWLVEYADGEQAVAKGYAKLEALAKRFQQIDGGDTSAQIFLGQPVSFSQGPHRVLFLPDGRGFSLTNGRMLAESDPLFHEELAVQEDGFLGPPDLAITTPPPRAGQARPVEELDELETVEELPDEEPPEDDDDGDVPVAR